MYRLTLMEVEAANKISNGEVGAEFEEPCPTSALASLMIALAETCSQDHSLVSNEESAVAFNAAERSPPGYDPEQDDYENEQTIAGFAISRRVHRSRALRRFSHGVSRFVHCGFQERYRVENCVQNFSAEARADVIGMSC